LIICLSQKHIKTFLRFMNLVSSFMVFPDDDLACPTMIGMRYDNLNLTGKSN